MKDLVECPGIAWRVISMGGSKTVVDELFWNRSAAWDRCTALGGPPDFRVVYETDPDRQANAQGTRPLVKKYLAA